jgi:tetratricopeptide (TPR) repeat protein
MAGREPIAADIRPGADGRRLAKLKLASGLLRVPLDELVRRDTQRRNRRLAGLSAASVAGMMIMGVLTLVAVEARLAEQQRRAEAEDLIEFMLGDLRNRLNAVGRLDVLDAVGEKATDYYANADRSRQTDASLGRRARAFLLLGEVGDLRGDMAAAESAFERAFDITSKLAERSPEDGAVLFDHAQSTFWIGFYGWRLGDLNKAERAFSEYLALARRLTSLDSDNPAWMAEFGHANYNLGVLALQRGRAQEATDYLDLALTAFRSAIDADPERTEWFWSLAQTHAWLADAYELSGDFNKAIGGRQNEIGIYQSLLEADAGNQDLRLSVLNASIRHADLLVQRGRLDAALALLEPAMGVADELQRLDQENTFVQQLAASTLSAIAEIDYSQGRRTAALEQLQAAELLAAELVTKDAAVVEWGVLLQQIRIRSSRYQMWGGEAELPLLSERLRRVHTALAGLAEASPDNLEIAAIRAEAQLDSADLEQRRGSPAAASRHADSVIRLLDPARSRLPPRSLATLAVASCLAGQSEQANALYAELATMRYAHPDYLARGVCAASESVTD